MVVVVLIFITLPLAWMQRKLLHNARKYAVMGSKGGVFHAQALNGRANDRTSVDVWGQGINLWDHLTLANSHRMFDMSSFVRGIINTVILSVFGGMLAVGIYLLACLAGHHN